MSTDTTATPTRLVADNGPVSVAGIILATRSTLSDHVTFQQNLDITQFKIADSVPFEVWGSSSQGLWRLLAAIVTRRYEVSLYEVVSRLDPRNQRAVADAVSALCGVIR